MYNWLGGEGESGWDIEWGSIIHPWPLILLKNINSQQVWLWESLESSWVILIKIVICVLGE